MSRSPSIGAIAAGANDIAHRSRAMFTNKEEYMKAISSMWVPMAVVVTIWGCGLEDPNRDDTAWVEETSTASDPEHASAQLVEFAGPDSDLAGAIPPALAQFSCVPLLGPSTGRYICGTVSVIFSVNSVPNEIVVIGTDFAIHHSKTTSPGVWGPWQSLNGVVHCKVDPASCGRLDGIRLLPGPKIQVLGTNNAQWCRTRPWTLGWGPC
jgi:hypothetical protein